MNNLWRAKLKAFSIHLLFSALIICSFMLLVTQVWFPDILFELENVWDGLRILIPVDAILGPLLTLILFVPHKKGLVVDLTIVATIQLLALILGGLAIYSQRPVVMAFAGDRFEIISSLTFDRDNFAASYFDKDELSYPLIIYALPGQTKEEVSTFVLNNVQYQKLSSRYRPLMDHQDIIRKKALLISKFVPANEKSVQTIKAFKETYSAEETLLFILEGTTSFSKVIILESKNLSLLGYLDLDPWTEYRG